MIIISSGKRKFDTLAEAIAAAHPGDTVIVIVPNGIVVTSEDVPIIPKQSRPTQPKPPPTSIIG
jgi:hypothetical protein